MKASIKKYSHILLLIAVFSIYISAITLFQPVGIEPSTWKAIVFVVCATIFWITEIIPIGISSCLLLFLPQLLGIDSTTNILADFAISTIFFMIAASIIAATAIKVGVVERVSNSISGIFGYEYRFVLLSYMLVTGLVSTFLADIPTTIIFCSTANKLLMGIEEQKNKSGFGKALMIGIPVSACLGGFATPVGSGINVLCLDLMKKFAGRQITFLQWSALGVPLAFVLILVAWAVLCFFCSFDTKASISPIKRNTKQTTHLTDQEKKFLLIFSLTLILWVTQGFHKLDLSFVSLLCISVFFLPGINLINWKEASHNVAWQSVLLVGASNAFAMMLNRQGATQWISRLLLNSFRVQNVIIIFLMVTLFGLFIHYLVPVASAVLAVGAPIVAVFGSQLGIDPVYLILILSITAKCIFLLPLDPIPLISYNYGYWKFTDMMKNGLVIAIAWVPIMVAAMFILYQLNFF